MEDKKWYQKGYRRLLLDMHIPDWDKKFLSKYDPVQLVKLYKKGGLSSSMFYSQAHTGLCYWPVRNGGMHKGLKGKDNVGITIKELDKAGMGTNIYYSLIYNNWAFLKHPDWRIIPAREGKKYGRYGYCCPNNTAHREFALSQIGELINGYKFNGLFFDMSFWPAICLCKSCREKFKKATGKEIPQKVDWLSPLWCKFAKLREEWMCEFIKLVADFVKNKNREISVYFNFATSFFNWCPGLSLKSAKYHDFLGGDFYGDSIEQLLVSKAMINLTENMPVEFATTANVSLNDHVRLKSTGELELQAFASTLFSSAFMFIDAINPDGTVNPANYKRFNDVYKKTKVYEPFLGGKPVEDIAVYFSDNSKMDFLENGNKLTKASARKCPHIQALRGVIRFLQRTHLPFGVITEKQFSNLNNYKVIILPNVLRLTRVEVEAFREYVKNGGSIYASRMTSLTDTEGNRFKDFMLADVFGCHLEKEEAGSMVYLKPAAKEIQKLIEPQKYVSHFSLSPDLDLKTVLLKKNPEGRTLANLTLSYYNKGDGSVFDKNWASIHSWPPWKDTKNPFIVQNRYGKGTSIYTAADIESVNSEGNYNLFSGLIKTLLGGRASFSADIHEDVWVSLAHRPEKKSLLLGFLNYQAKYPVIPVNNLKFKLKAPKGKKFTGLFLLPGKKKINFKTGKDGVLQAELKQLKIFEMLEAVYR